MTQKPTQRTSYVSYQKQNSISIDYYNSKRRGDSTHITCGCNILFWFIKRIQWLIWLTFWVVANSDDIKVVQFRSERQWSRDCFIMLTLC